MAVVCVGATDHAAGQTAPPGGIPNVVDVPRAAVCPPTNAGFPVALPTAPDQLPRPASGPGSVKEFVAGVSHNDATFEVLVGQGRILTTKVDLSVRGKPAALVAVGDPSIADFVVVNTRQIRVVGQRVGVTDLSVTTPEGQTYTFEVHVVTDLHVLQAQIACLFPDACVKLSQIRDHVVAEGQVRDVAQMNRVLEVIRAYLLSVQTGQARKVSAQGAVPRPAPGPPTVPQPKDVEAPPAPIEVGPEQVGQRSIQGTVATPQLINLLKVPGTQQVLLKVRVAELNRTAFRQIGADFLIGNKGNIVGTQIGGATVTGGAQVAQATGTGTTATASSLSGFAETLLSSSTTAFGVFDRGDFAVFLSALRRNSLLKVLAEPNLVALNGHAANFLAGGEFPIPVPQGGATGGVGAITVQFKEFGVRLAFLPTILDGDVIRLSVDPEVSSIDFSVGTVLVPGGTPVPGLVTRKAHTVVELREGQTLAMAGLLQLTLDGTTTRVPLLGDLPVLGPFFSNTTGTRTEKELIVLVTPYLVEPMNPGQVPPSPGDDVDSPTDWEFYLHRQIEARTAIGWQAPTPIESMTCPPLLKLDARNVRGPYGFSN